MTLVKHKKTPVRPSFFDSIFDDLFLGEPLPKSALGNRALKTPSANVQDNDSEWIVELVAPGWNKKDLNISVDEGILSITAEVQDNSQETEKNYARKEFQMSSFERRFQLPENANEDDIKAEYHNGILFIHIPKMESNLKKPQRQIQIG